MVLSHPFNTWPLHVKLFTEEATKIWTKVITKSGALPKGMTYTVELEGVDGKSDNPGSGRSGPIDVTDGSHCLHGYSRYSLMALYSPVHIVPSCQGPKSERTTIDLLCLQRPDRELCIGTQSLICITSMVSLRLCFA